MHSHFGDDTAPGSGMDEPPDVSPRRRRIAALRRLAGIVPPLVAQHLVRLGLSRDRAAEMATWVDTRSVTGSSLPVNTADYHGYRFALTGYFQWRNVAISRCLLQPGDVVIEVGANVGTETVCLCDLVGPGGRVVAVEPVLSNLEVLSDLAAAPDRSQLEIVAAVCSDSAGTAHFVLPPPEASGIGHISRSESSQDEAVQVEATTLDDLAAEHGVPRLVLTDCEGAEPLVLAGGSDLLSSEAPALIIEASPKLLARNGESLLSLYERLRGVGYRVFRIERFGLREQSLAEGLGKGNWLCLAGPDIFMASRAERAIKRAGFLPPTYPRGPLARVRQADSNRGVRELSVALAAGGGTDPGAQYFERVGLGVIRGGGRAAQLVQPSFSDIKGPAGIDRLVWPSQRPTRWADFRLASAVFKKRSVSAVVANFGAVNVSLLAGAVQRVPTRVAWYRTLRAQLEGDRPRLVQWLLVQRKRIVLRLATHVVANSTAALEDVVQHFGVPRHRVAVFYNGLPDPKEGTSLPSSRENHLLCVGRFHPSKGQRTLVEAIALLGDSASPVEFVGDGKTRAEIEALADGTGVASLCHFRGALPHDDVLESMARCRAVVVPSLSEAFGYVVIEALATGTPVIASRVGGIPELYDDEVEGLVFAPGNAADLCDAIRALPSGAAYDRMSAAARFRFESEFELTRQADRFTAALQRLHTSGW